MTNVCGHCLDLDDGHRQALGHPGVCVVPAALALGESLGSSGKQILTAIIAGYETFIRMGKSLNPAIFSAGIPYHRRVRYNCRRCIRSKITIIKTGKN